MDDRSKRRILISISFKSDVKANSTNEFAMPSFTIKSEKKDKRRWNKIFRQTSKACIIRDMEPPKKLKEVCNVWSGAKDGRSYKSL